VGWCPVLLSKLVVLQAKHSWDDRETVARCGYDLVSSLRPRSAGGAFVRFLDT